MPESYPDLNFIGTVEPISLDQLWEVPCIRCGQPSQCQWNVCANKGLSLSLCLDCDIELNRVVLKFLGFQNPESYLEWYVEKLTENGLR